MYFMTILLCRLFPLWTLLRVMQHLQSAEQILLLASISLSQIMPLSPFDLFLLFSENSPFYKLSNATLTAEHSLGKGKKNPTTNHEPYLLKKSLCIYGSLFFFISLLTMSLTLTLIQKEGALSHACGRYIQMEKGKGALKPLLIFLTFKSILEQERDPTSAVPFSTTQKNK